MPRPRPITVPATLRRTAGRGLTFAIPTLMSAAAAVAQSGEVDRAPESSKWIAVVIAIVLILAIGVPTFKHPKRSHQD